MKKIIEKCIYTYFINYNYALLPLQHRIINDGVWNEYNLSMQQERYFNYINKY